MRQTTCGTTRCMPLHPSTRDVLHQEARCRDHLWPRPPTVRFLRSERGTPLTGWSVQRTFVRLSHQIGLRGATARSGPRLHDLRQSFAVRTRLHWYRTGVDVEQRLPTLSASLGHAHVNDTVWSLAATPGTLPRGDPGPRHRPRGGARCRLRPRFPTSCTRIVPRG